MVCCKGNNISVYIYYFPNKNYIEMRIELHFNHRMEIMEILYKIWRNSMYEAYFVLKSLRKIEITLKSFEGTITKLWSIKTTKLEVKNYNNIANMQEWLYYNKDKWM